MPRAGSQPAPGQHLQRAPRPRALLAHSPNAHRGTHPLGLLCRGTGGSSPASLWVLLCFTHPGSSGRAPRARVSRRQQEKGRSVLARAMSSSCSALPCYSSQAPPCKRPCSNQEPKENTD